MTKEPFEYPYNFVPLSTQVHFPAWSERASQDVPFQDGVCGTIDIRVEATTPIFTRGDDDPERFTCLRKGDLSTAYLKGSTLKGLIRSVLEIATFSKFGTFVDDRRFGIRDISRSETEYSRRLRRVDAGWLEREGDKVFITPCSFAKIHKSELESRGGKGWFSRARDVKGRYESWQTPLDGEFTLEGGRNDMTAKFASTGSKRRVKGRLVFTGYINKKAHEFVFYGAQESREEISPTVWQEFVWAHSGTQQRPEIGADGQDRNESLDYWWGRLQQGERVPVFFLRKEGAIRWFGLARMFRIASDLSVHDAVRNVTRAHFDEQLDFAQTLFGATSDDDALKGRVVFGPALVEGRPTECQRKSLLLSSPKPSFYPAYLADGGDWTTRKAKARGWKRYGARTRTMHSPGGDEKLKTKFRPLAEFTAFTGRIYLHNVRPVELGALLWCLDFGGDAAARHQLGLAKAFGYGNVRITIAGCDLEPNDLDDPTPPALDTARTAFVSYMDEMLDGGWRESQQIATLLAMARPGNEPVIPGYPELKEFKALKSQTLAPPLGLDAAKQRLADTVTNSDLVAPYVRELEEQKRRAEERARHEERARAEEEARRREREAEREAARREPLGPRGRAEEDLAGWTEKQCYDWTKTQLAPGWDRLDEDLQARREVVAERYYRRWVHSNPITPQVPKGPRLVELAGRLVDPDDPSHVSEVDDLPPLHPDVRDAVEDSTKWKAVADAIHDDPSPFDDEDIEAMLEAARVHLPRKPKKNDRKRVNRLQAILDDRKERT